MIRSVAARAVIALPLLACACTVIQPVAVIGQHGDVLTGTTVATLSGGSFSAANGRLKCSGAYNSLSMAATIQFTTLCSDGRKGFGTAVRDDTMEAGQGVIHMEDGETASFIFGAAAAIFTPKVGS
jgi:poly(3-hydroxybutyrate) depolymerase